jgi:DNA-nicking Smr family endonuclease
MKTAVRASKPRLMASPLAVGVQPGGIDKATWQRFRSGRLVATRTLDLHGMTAQRADHALVSFIRTAHAEQARCVEVVTGRGSGETGGVIRREFPLWLNLPEIRPLILGAAHPHSLNPGSVRLVLRRIR